MRQFKRLSAVAIIVICLHSCKKEQENHPDFRTSAASMEASGGSEKAYVILCKNLDVSTKLISKINLSGTVTASMKELGIVLANSSNPDFAATVMLQDEVQSVAPDIELNWLDDSWVPEGQISPEDQVSLDVNGGVASEWLPDSRSIGLSGTNPFVPLQWNLKAVNAPAAFRAGYKGKGAVVAVLDQGWYLQNTDLSPNKILDTISFLPGEAVQVADPNELSHGTLVTGVIAAADNDIGTVGIAPEASLILVRVIKRNGTGGWGPIIQGVYYAATKGANIINMSFVSALIARDGKIYNPGDSLISNDAKGVQVLINALNRTFQYASKKGCTNIAAAGNHQTEVHPGSGQASLYPANCPNVIAVSSTGPLGWAYDQDTSLFPISYFTDYGIGFIDFSGPGGNFRFPRDTTPFQFGQYTLLAAWLDQVISPSRPNMYGFFRGTSLSTPAVSAVAALIAGKYNGKISASLLQSILKNSAVDLGEPGVDAFYGMGQVDAGLAIKQ